MKDIFDVALEKGAEAERERCLKICDKVLRSLRLSDTLGRMIVEAIKKKIIDG